MQMILFMVSNMTQNYMKPFYIPNVCLRRV